MRIGGPLQLSLRWSDVKEDGIHIQPRKTAHSSGKRLVIMWDEQGILKSVLESIKGLRRPTGSIYLFCNRRGQPYIKADGTTRGFQSMWQRWQDKALRETKLKERIRERWLRTKVGSDQESAEMAARILAHSDTKTTQKFYREKPDTVVAFIPSKSKNDTKQSS